MLADAVPAKTQPSGYELAGDGPAAPATAAAPPVAAFAAAAPGAAAAATATVTSSHVAALEDALDFEVYVDMGRLRELAAVALPPELRPKCYPLLLGVAPVDKTAEMTAMRHLADRFAALLSSKRDEDASRGRRLKRLVGSAMGARLPQGLRNELMSLVLPSSTATTTTSSHAIVIAGVGPATALSTVALTGAALGTTITAAATTLAGPSPYTHPSISSAERMKQLAAIEAVLATHIPEVSSAQCYVRGAPALLAPIEVAFEPNTNAPRLVARRDPEGQHFVTAQTDDPFSWHLAATLALATAVDSAQDAYYCAEALHTLLTAPRGLWSHSGLRETYSTFIMVLRHSVDDVYWHLHALGVNNLRWAPSMLGSLFADRLPTARLLDLWDWYIATGDFSLHAYVCAALVEHWVELILDLGGDDFLQFIAGPWESSDLPPTATLIRTAAKMREDVRARKLI
jgi:hypothetical protein